MSGDVQPRKRKDKKKKRDDIGFEEPKGTAAALGDGDLFLHSHHDHGTGGHWCAKIIFFSLLAVLVTLIGLIIFENRGLTELEANSVQTQYSGVLEGWLEDAPDDDHHDEHTLELKHPDKDERVIKKSYNYESIEDKDDDDEGLDKDNLDEINEDEQDSNEYDNANDDDNKNDEYDDANEDDDKNDEYDDGIKDGGYANEDDENEADNNEYDDEDENNNNDNHLEENESYETETAASYEHFNDDDDDEKYSDNESAEYDKDNNDEEEHDNHDDDEEQDEEVEVEHIEEEPSDLEPISTELPALPEEDDDDDNDKNASKQDDDDDKDGVDDDTDDDDDQMEDNDIDYLEPPVVEHVSAPSGKPYVEFEDSKEEMPVDTLAEEEEYEKLQEELRREEEESTSHIWLKLGIGAALLAATHAVMRRAAGPDSNGNTEENEVESSSLSDRRMTIIPNDEEEEAEIVPDTNEVVKKDVPRENIKHTPILIQTTRPTIEDDEEEEEEIESLIPEPTQIINVQRKSDKKEVIPDKEYYSDEDEEEEKKSSEVLNENYLITNEDNDDEVPDDVEIIDDEQIDEEMEEEAEDEEISDVDDAELLSRLEAKYGRLPEPHRPEPPHKSGGKNADDLWPDEPDSEYWLDQLDQAEQQIHEDTLSSLKSVVARLDKYELQKSARARWLSARAKDRMAEILRDNTYLKDCISAYLHVLELSDRLTNKHLWMVANRTIDRMNFQGNYLKTEHVYRLLIKRFPEEPAYRNNLTIAFLMANRADKAVVVIKETLKLWPDDRIALAHFGFVQKTLYNELEESVSLFRRALEGDKGPAVEPRFYYHLGDALLLLGRKEEAHAVHERGAALGMFLSATQRSLYNVDRLKSSPWWDVYKSPYRSLAEALERSWKKILIEGERAREFYEQEKEGLKERGEWSQLDMFVRGREVSSRCAQAPVTCDIVRSEPAAARCRRGQVKFSSMAAGTHVRAHVGPTNCRLRMHLALSNTKDTYLRVGNETRQWEVGKVLMFDDSFEHEVWHNGTAPRLVLIVDVWHPDLTAHERRTLPAI